MNEIEIVEEYIKVIPATEEQLKSYDAFIDESLKISTDYENGTISLRKFDDLNNKNHDKNFPKFTKEQLDLVPNKMYNYNFSDFDKKLLLLHHGTKLPSYNDGITFILDKNDIINFYNTSGEIVAYGKIPLKETSHYNLNNLTLNKNAMSTTAQEIPTTENKVYYKEKEVGDVVSVKWDHGTTIIQGIVKEINGNSLTIDTKSHGLVIAENNKEVYKFSPYQRIDLRELSMPLKEKTGFQDKDGNDIYKTVKSKLDSLLFSKTEHKTFDNWSKKNNGCLVTLLKGNLIHNNIKGESLLPQRDENKNIIANAPKRLVPWEAKFQVYRGKDGELKIDTIYKERQELSFKLFNKEVTPEEKEKLLKGESVPITRNRNAGGEFKLFARIDTDLNKIVTKPYSAKTEIVMQAAYARKEAEALAPASTKETIVETPTAKENFKTSLKEKLEEKEAPKKAKGKRI